MIEKIRNYKADDKPVALIDFDGVIHSYKRGWKGVEVISDAPMDGALEWLAAMTKVFKVVIFSARCNDQRGIDAMQQWFIRWGLPQHILSRIEFEPGKPSAFVIIDDRAIPFSGKFVPPDKLAEFEPWYYDNPEWKRKQ